MWETVTGTPECEFVAGTPESGLPVWRRLKDAVCDRLGAGVLDDTTTFEELPVAPADITAVIVKKQLSRTEVDAYSAEHGLESPQRIAARIIAAGSLRAAQERARIRELFAAAPLPLVVEKLPPFPVDALPPVLAEMVTGVSHQFDVDPAMPAVFALGAMSAALQGRLVVRGYPGWTENGSLYGLSVADSGQRKSPVLRSMFSDPIDAAERELRAEYWHADPEPLLVGGGDGEDAVPDILTVGDTTGLVCEPGGTRVPEGDEPPPPRLVASDITPEKLAQLMSAQGGVMCLADAEGSALDMVLGVYGNNAPNIRLYLQAYSRERVLVDRKNTPDGIDLDEPSLTLCLATQHDTWNRVMSTPRLAGSGFNSRLAVAYCETRASPYARWLATPASERPNLGVPVPAAVVARYRARVTGLAVHMRDQSSRTVELTEEAQQRVREYSGIYGELDRRIMGADGDLTGAVVAWAAKSGGRTLRTALMLHAAQHGADCHRLRIDLETINAAILIEEWFIANARAAHDMVSGVGSDRNGEATVEDIKALRDWLIRKHRGDSVKPWEPFMPMPLNHIRQAGPKKQRVPSIISTAIDALEALNVVVRSTVNKTKVIYLHPDLYDDVG